MWLVLCIAMSVLTGSVHVWHHVLCLLYSLPLYLSLVFQILCNTPEAGAGCSGLYPYNERLQRAKLEECQSNDG